jgi:hypothetical protein
MLLLEIIFDDSRKASSLISQFFSSLEYLVQFKQVLNKQNIEPVSVVLASMLEYFGILFDESIKNMVLCLISLLFSLC